MSANIGGLGIQYCEKPDQLEFFLENVRDKNNLVIQEFIKGEDIGVEALFRNGELMTYNYAVVLNYMYSKFSFTTRRTYSRNEEMEKLLIKLGSSLGLNGFASIGYIYHPERKTYYLIEVDARVNSWMPYGRFTGADFSEGIKQYLNIGSGKIESTEIIRPYDKKMEIAIFDRDIRRCMKYKDMKGISNWVLNDKGYWRFIPFYDFKLLKKTLKKMLFDLLKIKY